MGITCLLLEFLFGNAKTMTGQYKSRNDISSWTETLAQIKQQSTYLILYIISQNKLDLNT